MTWICWVLLFTSCSVNCKKNGGSKVIATFSEDDISDKLPSPESVAAQIPKKLILKESIKKLKISKSNKNPNVVDKKKRNKKRDSSPESTENSFDRKTKSMNGLSEDELPYGPDNTENTENFIVVQPIEDQKPTSIQATGTESGIQTPTASIVQIANIYATTKAQEQDFTSIPPKKEKVRRLIPNERMNVKRARSSSSSISTNIVLAFITLAAIIALA